MAEYKTVTLYVGTTELAESFKEKATATVFGTPSAMVQAIAKGEAVVVPVEILDALPRLTDIREFGVDIPQYAEEAFEALEKIID